MSRRRRVPRRKRFFVGCEGESEQGYVALLQRLANDNRLNIHLDAKVMAKAGDPLTLVERAEIFIEQGESGPKPRYAGKYLLLDTDQLGVNRDRDIRMWQIARRIGLTLVQQDCCFEAVLLRHFDGHENDRPPNATIALHQLRDVWPQYRKGTPALVLAKRLSHEDVRNAAVNPLNAGFQPFLRQLGLIR